MTLEQMRGWLFFEDDERLRWEMEEGILSRDRPIYLHFTPEANEEAAPKPHPHPLARNEPAAS